MTVTKRELTLRIAGKLGMSPQDVARIVDALIETLGDRLIRNERWEFRGFGVFEVRERAARLGRNLRTGELVPVPPHRAVVFLPGKFMKQEIARWDSVLEKGGNVAVDTQSGDTSQRAEEELSPAQMSATGKDPGAQEGIRA